MEYNVECIVQRYKTMVGKRVRHLPEDVFAHDIKVERAVVTRIEADRVVVTRMKEEATLSPCHPAILPS
jgi:hypothetical protein